jgi:thioredoxin-related protein
MKTILSLAALAALSAVAVADDVAEKKGSEWYADFDTAAAVAKAQKKDLLVDFTGSDWCVWCKRLHKEVFEQPEFEAEAPKSFVLVALDFDGSGQSKGPHAERSNALKDKFEIRGFPTVVVLTPDEEVLARGSYAGADKGAKFWLDAISKDAAAGRGSIVAAIQLEAEYAAADKDETRAAVAGRAADRIQADSKTGAPMKKLASVARHGFELDPENKTGLGAKSLKAVFAAGEAGEAEAALAKKLDPKNEAGLLEYGLAARMVKVMRGGEGGAEFVAEAKVLAAGELKDPDVYVPALANACVIAVRQLDDAASAKEIAEALKKRRPDDERLQKFLERFLK